MKKNNKGFTLVELIVVIAILGVLMAVLVPQYIQYVEKSREATDLSTLGEIFHIAEIESATTEGAIGAVTIAVSAEAATKGSITATGTTGDANSLKVAEAINDALGTSGKLKSTDGQTYTSQLIVFEDSTVKWAKDADDTTRQDTQAFFLKLADGKKTP